MGKGSSSPQTPDPYTTAGAQTQSNEQTALYNAQLNRYNQYSPTGSSTWNMSPNGSWSNTTSLSPSLTTALDQQMQGAATSQTMGNEALNNSWGSIISPLNTSSLPGIQSSVNTNFANQVNQAQNSSYNAQMALLQPQQQQQTESLQAQLAAQGVVPGSEAYNNAINNQARQNSFTNTQVANNAVQTGNAMQNQLFGQSLNAGQFQNAANLQGLQQQQTLQNQPLSVWGALSGNQINMPSFSNTGGSATAGTQAAPTDISSDIWNAYQGNVNSSNAQNAQANQQTSEEASMAAMALMAFMM
jgi:hypothetical protein